MKKVLYFILLVVEFLVSCLLLMRAASWVGWLFFTIVTVVWVILMAWQLTKLQKAEEDKATRNAKILIALIMNLPAVAAIGSILWIGYRYF